MACSHVANLYLDYITSSSEEVDVDVVSLRENNAGVDRKRAETYAGILNLVADGFMYKQAGVEPPKEEGGGKELIVDYGKEVSGVVMNDYKCTPHTHLHTHTHTQKKKN
jgi:hypothetical protein